MFRAEQEIEFREKYRAEPRLCVACDEVAKSQKRWQQTESTQDAKAYEGGVYHVIQTDED